MHDAHVSHVGVVTRKVDDDDDDDDERKDLTLTADDALTQPNPLLLGVGGTTRHSDSYCRRQLPA